MNNKSNLARTTLFFVLLTFILSLADLDVFLLKIPEFNQLETGHGSINFSLTPLSRGSSLILGNKGKTIELNCWITSVGTKDCFATEDKNPFKGKNAKAWWYEARINGFFTENRLLQLEVDGKLVINYLDQRNKYIKIKESYIYVWPMFFCVAVFFYFIVRFSNNCRNSYST
ncbi:hypothetical protein [Methylomonas albis]|uniref:Uncharacterized protein n=1 Tax=Methylomonas albis TaxID=1854563 RepID=A0ABR9D4Q8_9GAMM|nr:hypothetical protein [Methylomonas albis]MBD9358093.1 hypothetical protein [Methylomonas albis]